MSQSPMDESLTPEQQTGRSLGIASLVLGIITDVFIFIGPFGLLGLVTGIVGIVLGAMGRKRLPEGRRGMATAGLVCSIVGVSIIALLALGTLLFFGSLLTLGLAQ